MINIIIMKFIATFIYFNKYISKFKACINNIDFSPYIFFMYPFSILNLFQDFNIINQFLVFCKICTALTVHSTTIIIFDRANQRFYKRCRIYFYHFCRMMHLTRSQFFLESSQQNSLFSHFSQQQLFSAVLPTHIICLCSDTMFYKV